MNALVLLEDLAAHEVRLLAQEPDRARDVGEGAVLLLHEDLRGDGPSAVKPRGTRRTAWTDRLVLHLEVGVRVVVAVSILC